MKSVAKYRRHGIGIIKSNGVSEKRRKSSENHALAMA